MRARKELENRIVDLWEQYLTAPEPQSRYAAGAACLELVWALELSEEERSNLYSQAVDRIWESQ
jgi:hypothetical protein